MPARLDLKGRTFGYWKVIEYAGNSYWKCICTLCNTEHNVHRGSLVKGLSNCCKKCSLKIQAEEKRKQSDLSGKTINEWTLLEYLGDDIYKCRCSCGKIKNVHIYNIKSEKSKSCGCKRREKQEETLKQLYGEIHPIKVGNNREQWQIDTLENEELLKEFILKEYGIIKPTFKQLARRLGVTMHGISVKVHKYKLEELVYIDPLHSDEETELLEYIKSLTDKKVIQGDKNIINPYELDIYIPDLNLAFEFNGTYWHSDEKIKRKYHQNKSLACIKNNIRLIHIFEYEWKDSNKKEKIKKFIKNIISTDKSIYYARNLRIKEISNNEAIEFENINHLQLSVHSNINIALIDKNNDIKQIMTFGKPRFNYEYQYELLRLTSELNSNIVGGANKIFKYFINKYKPSSIISYCDLSKFKGEIYEKLGFNYDGITEPNYVWVNHSNTIILPRYKTMKHKLIENGIGTEEQTEDEIMKSADFYKIYDSGNIRFTWKNREKKS